MLNNGRKLLVLTYHRVVETRDALVPGHTTAEEFAVQLQVLARFVNVLNLDEAIDRLQSSSLPPRAVCITFDDGYADNVTVALPLLQRYKLPATFFISTGFIDGGRMWNDTVIESIRQARRTTLSLDEFELGKWNIEGLQERQQALSSLLPRIKYLARDQRTRVVESIARQLGLDETSDLMMTSENVVELDRVGMAIGGHTVSHPILTRIEDHEAEAEIAENKRVLEKLTSSPVTCFAYPNGKPGRDYSHVHVDLVKRCGYLAAMSTAPGCAGTSTDPFQIGRIGIWGSRRPAILLRLFYNFFSPEPETV